MPSTDPLRTTVLLVSNSTGQTGRGRVLIYQLIFITQLPASASFGSIITFPFPERGRCVLLTYVCGFCGQVPAKALAGLMGGLEFAKGAWQHSGVINESLLRKKWGRDK